DHVAQPRLPVALARVLSRAGRERVSERLEAGTEARRVVPTGALLDPFGTLAAQQQLALLLGELAQDSAETVDVRGGQRPVDERLVTTLELFDRARGLRLPACSTPTRATLAREEVLVATRPGGAPRPRALLRGKDRRLGRCEHAAALVDPAGGPRSRLGGPGPRGACFCRELSRREREHLDPDGRARLWAAVDGEARDRPQGLRDDERGLLSGGARRCNERVHRAAPPESCSNVCSSMSQDVQ